jgi:FlaA1/EpsC-like NDP-sugar epimerase
MRISEIFLALPSASRARRREIVEKISAAGVAVRALPSVGNIIEGQVQISDLRDVQVEELLGRDAVAPVPELLAKTIVGQTVLVTGAGGSIGSELCRQIMRQKPHKLVLVDQSELALYEVERELVTKAGEASVIVVAELCDVADAASIGRVMAAHRPHSVFHAAAYKHVPLVEANPIAGLRNNVFGSLNTVHAAESAGVGYFILVSTDKAVRPTNVMGASKRICEQILQARSAAGVGPVFSMVRFGNVLGSSGSVVPLFRRQIQAGGPVTLTDRRITRYFMTIPEAAELVIQAGAMASGGEVFVLDMGQSVRIFDLAVTMIHLSGLTLRDDTNPDGDIEIREVGLRAGEKLYEELLIGNNPQRTSHERIVQAHESFVGWEELSKALDQMAIQLRSGHSDNALKIMRQLVPEYSASQP